MNTVHILKGGLPATDLQPYLGALAHAVFVNASDLSYVHVHPIPIGSRDAGKMDMGTMPPGSMQARPLPAGSKSAPDMALHVALKEPGTYKLWLQFLGGGTLHVAQFVLTAT